MQSTVNTIFQKWEVVGSNPVSGKAYQVNDVVEWILPELGHPDEGFVRVGKDLALELEESEMHFWVL